MQKREGDFGLHRPHLRTNSGVVRNLGLPTAFCKYIQVDVRRHTQRKKQQYPVFVNMFVSITCDHVVVSVISLNVFFTSISCSLLLTVSLSHPLFIIVFTLIFVLSLSCPLFTLSFLSCCYSTQNNCRCMLGVLSKSENFKATCQGC